MAKTTDITGSFRVPQEAWGSFWNFMLTLDGADITPNTRTKVEPATKRQKNGKTSNGSTGVCIILRAASHAPLYPKEAGQLLVDAGKARTGAGSVLNWCKKEKLLKHDESKMLYTITSAGNKYLETHCSL